MSNPESFIEEVTEEVRRDRLFVLFRRYGWIGLVVILGIVGGTAANEWWKARQQAVAEGFGDALIAALDHDTPEDRRAALAAVPADAGRQRLLLDLILATDPAQDKAGTLAALDKVLADAALPDLYRDLAVLRRVLVAGADQPLADRRAALTDIATTGRPYRALAAEQLAYLLVEEGNTDAAIAALLDLTKAEDSPDGLKNRAAQIITALGGDPNAGEEAASGG